MMPAPEDFAENLGLALLLGAVIGIEREWRSLDAGMRTNALVSAGSAVFTMMALGIAGGQNIAAQIVTGIGFIGAGNILKSGEHVRGLTTAATMWVVAAIGMVAGMGERKLALLATGAVLLVNLVLMPLEHWFVDRKAERALREAPPAPRP
jgi:putative Mg2+ transporter-C (MgtC) family protein